jgi:hypothetical protein
VLSDMISISEEPGRGAQRPDILRIIVSVSGGAR